MDRSELSLICGATVLLDGEVRTCTRIPGHKGAHRGPALGRNPLRDDYRTWDVDGFIAEDAAFERTRDAAS